MRKPPGHWLLYALAAVLCWGLWGFLAKLGSETTSPAQMQTFFTLGMLPLAAVILIRRRFRIDLDRKGGLYGLLNGIFTTLGLLAYYAAMGEGKASVVGPVTALYPLLTVTLAFFLLKERFNRPQLAGIALAMLAIILFST